MNDSFFNGPDFPGPFFLPRVLHIFVLVVTCVDTVETRVEPYFPVLFVGYPTQWMPDEIQWMSNEKITESTKL